MHPIPVSSLSLSALKQTGKNNLPVRSISLCCYSLLLVLLTGPGSTVYAQPDHSPDVHNPTLTQQQKQAEASKKNVQRLTRQERRLHADLARTEDKLTSSATALKQNETKLTQLQQELHNTQARYHTLQTRQQQIQQQLDNLTPALWPLKVRTLQGRSAQWTAWHEANRYYTWARTLHKAQNNTLHTLLDNTHALKQTIAQQQTIQQQVTTRLTAINAKKDKLLEDRLDFTRQIRTVRAQRLSDEQELKEILGTIKDINYQLQENSVISFIDAKGSLSVPVQGRRLPAAAIQIQNDTRGEHTRHTRKATLPVRHGAGFSTSAAAQVRAVHWGKVVHAHMLRGYGKVVILFHGNDYYTLYAFLSESTVEIGREVEKGEVLGTAGYYPAAKGPGLYFELRLGQKTITIANWFAELS